MLYPELYFLPDFVLERLGFDLRVHPSTWRSVVYVGLQAHGNFTPIGTGFCAGVEHRGNRFFFFITADHVVDMISGDTVYIRMNKKDGNAGSPIPIDKKLKIPGLDRSHDLAIFPVPPLHEGYDADYVFMGPGDFEKILEEVWRPQPGDEVATIGLYTSHHGHTKNIPVVRVGHIAMLPNEPVMSTRGYVEAYLVETRSILGLSGSPVCITIPPMRVVDGKIQILDTGLGAICIGMMLGYHLSASVDDQIVVPVHQETEQQIEEGHDESGDKLSLEERNTGFAVVLPIERILEVMESEPVRKAMDDTISKTKGRVRPAGVPVVERPEAVPPANGENPTHREDFTRLLGEAARKRERED
jgi:hypothetical protein